MAGGWAGEVASTSRSTAGQDDHHVEDEEEIEDDGDENNEEIEDDSDENKDEKEFDCDLLEHRLDPVDRLCLASSLLLTNCGTSRTKFRSLQCCWEVH